MTITAMAQSGRKSIAIKEFTRTENVSESYAHALRNRVIEVINSTSRFEIVDTTDTDYQLDGYVISITTSRTLIEKYKTYAYEAKIAFQLSVTEGNKFIGNKTFEIPSSSLLDFPPKVHYSESDAVNAALNRVEKGLKKFVDEHFYLSGTVVELAETKNNDAKKLYIDLGSEKGIIKGQRLDVNVEKTIKDKTIHLPIGEIEVESVVGDGVSLCKVRKGGKEIFAAINEGRNLTVITKVK